MNLRVFFDDRKVYFTLSEAEIEYFKSSILQKIRDIIGTV